MALFNRSKTSSKKAIRITSAAEIIGCSAESIRLGLVGNFQTFKLNPEKNNSPLLMFESELKHFLDMRDRRMVK